MKKTISVIGHTGMVGGTVYNYYKNKGYKTYGYTKNNQMGSLPDIFNADYIFVCVPTPFDWKRKRYNLRIAIETIELIEKTCKNQNTVVILKSTMLPGTTENLQRLTKLPLLFNPEFLSEATAEEDFINPDRQLVGYTNQSFKYATEVLHLLPNSPYDVIMTATEAEIDKFINNFHGGLMVIFANLFSDICNHFGADFEVVKKAAQASKWVGSPMGRMYWNVNHGGFRGYGGKCFPKDINGLCTFLDVMKIKHEIVSATIIANKRILKEQGLTEEEVEKRSNRTEGKEG